MTSGGHLEAWHFQSLPKNAIIARSQRLDRRYRAVLVTLFVFRKPSHSYAACRSLKPKLQQCFRPASSVCTLSVVLRLLVSPGACDHRFCTTVGGFQNTKSITKTARYRLSSRCEGAIIAFFSRNQNYHASRRPPDVFLRRSFTRPSTTLAVIEGLGTRLPYIHFTLP